MTDQHAPQGAAFDADHAHGFLAQVYGGLPGLLQICHTGNWAGEFFTTDPAGITAAVVHAQLLDRSQPEGIYFRATTVTQRPVRGRRGTAELTAAVPFLWADLDHGTEGHQPRDGQRPNPPTAEDAFALIAAAGLPEPTTLIHSGGGWYPLLRPSQPLPVEQAPELSSRIQDLLLVASTARGWHYGTGVKDLARVLRLPGSVNRKAGNARPCRVVGGTGQAVDAAAIPRPDPVIVQRAAPTTPPPPPRRPVGVARLAGPLDALADNTTWADILEPAGWTFVAAETEGAERWLRPGGASSEYSARAFPNNLVVHSDNAGLPTGAGQRLTKGRVYAYLWHGGDTSAAARDLVLAAHGAGGSPAAHALPAAVLPAVAAVNAAHDADVWGQLGVNTTLLSHAVGQTGPAPRATPEAAPVNDRPQLALAPPPQPAGLARFLLPYETWTYSPVMQHIYAAGWARLVSPDVLLHGVLTLLASLLHHGSRVETGKGTSVLSYYVAAIGASGAGKSEALTTARALLANWSGMRFALTGGDGYIDAPLGSGEGLIEAFMGVVYVDKLDAEGKPINDALGMPVQIAQRAQVRHNALFAADEGRQVLAAGERKGSTILAVLCEMWSGATAGQTNAESTRTRKLEAGTYVVGLLAGFQPGTIDSLFADEAGGAPQRFVFAPAEYAPFGLDLDSEQVVSWPGELNPAIPVAPVTVTLGHDQQREVRRAIRAKAAGLSTDSPLDGHRMLIRCRVAALLALLHGRTDVDAGLWALAEVITTRSGALRDWLSEQGARKAAEQARARQDATIETTVRAQARVQATERVTRAAGQIARAVERAGGQLTRGKALHGIRSDLRDVRDQALDYAAAAGLIEVSEDGRTLTLPDGGPE